PQEQRQQRCLPLLPGEQAGGDRLRQSPVARLFVPGGDPLLVPDCRLLDRRNADPVRESSRRYLEDQHARSGFGTLDLARLGGLTADWARQTSVISREVVLPRPASRATLRDGLAITTLPISPIPTGTPCARMIDTASLWAFPDASIWTNVLV